MLRAETIKDRHSDIFTFLQGDLASTATQCHQPEETGSESLVYLSEQKHLDCVVSHDPAIVIVHDKLLPSIHAGQEWRGCLFSVTAIPSAMAALLQYFDRKAERFAQWGTHHPTALVHPTATVGEDVILGPYCVIGANAVIGAGAWIGSHTVVENDASIGARTILHPHVFVGSACEVGANCEIHPHSSIGSDGFGYAPGPQGKPMKICQLGNVVIGDDVEIGSNCAIDRATLTSTFIRSGAKLDNICHIAHNCDLGEYGLYTAGFMMGGSTKIGRGFVTGGNSVVSAHLTLTDNVHLAGRSSVTNNVTRPGAYGGYPLQRLPDALKTAVNTTRLSKLRRDLRKVMKHLGITSDDDLET